MNRILIAILFVISCQSIEAQIVDDIERGSDDNKSSGSSDNSSSDLTSAACTEACGCAFQNADVLFYIFLAIGEGLHKADSIISTREDTIPRINSCKLLFDGGIAKTKNELYIPRIQLNGALISTDLRLFFIAENDLTETKKYYSTFDWQILMFNLVVNRTANFRIGSGFMYENYSSTIFNEHSLMFDIYPINELQFSLEGRIALDYKTGTMVRQEFSIATYYNFYSWHDVKLNALVKYSRSNYYEKVSFGAIHTGFVFNFY